MKKIEATIQINKVDVVASAITDIVDGIYNFRRKWKRIRKKTNCKIWKRYRYEVTDYNKVAIISTIVKDSEVEKISEVIVNVVFTGEKGDGIIAVSDIDSVLNITTKKKISESI